MKKIIIGVSTVVILICSGLVYNHRKDESILKNQDFTPTPHIEQILSKNSSEKFAIVFYKKGCPYCRAAKAEVLFEAKQTKFPVYYVDTESKIGQKLVVEVAIKYASTITVFEQNKKVNYSYADKIAGDYVPLTHNIWQAFDLEG
jgi:thiol-disulfide isomerase/thioredoxin